MKLNILCQSPVFQGMTHSESIRQTIDLAKYSEKLGYSRFWVSEHHNSNAFASASPEIMVTRIASETNQIRIGTAGILLSHYSPLKIAEQSNMITSLFPNRFDLGIGRAGGSDAKTLKALESHILQNDNSFERFNQLIKYIEQSKSPSIKAYPIVEEIPEYWVLGTSIASARYAAEKGLRYSFASFINDEQCLNALQEYHQHFQPSKYLDKPYVNLGIFAICADTEEAALTQVKSSEAWFVNSFIRGKNVHFPTQEEAKQMSYTMQEEMILNYRRKSRFEGDKNYIASQLNQLANQLRIDEFTIVTITEHFEDRKRSYELISEGFTG